MATSFDYIILKAQLHQCDPRSVLGLPTDAACTFIDAQHAFRKLALLIHPDKEAVPPSSDNEAAQRTELTGLLTVAWDKLKTALENGDVHNGLAACAGTDEHPVRKYGPRAYRPSAGLLSTPSDHNAEGWSLQERMARDFHNQAVLRQAALDSKWQKELEKLQCQVRHTNAEGNERRIELKRAERRASALEGILAQKERFKPCKQGAVFCKGLSCKDPGNVKRVQQELQGLQQEIEELRRILRRGVDGAYANDDEHAVDEVPCGKAGRNSRRSNKRGESETNRKTGVCGAFAYDEELLKAFRSKDVDRVLELGAIHKQIEEAAVLSSRRIPARSTTERVDVPDAGPPREVVDLEDALICRETLGVSPQAQAATEKPVIGYWQEHDRNKTCTLEPERVDRDLTFAGDSRREDVLMVQRLKDKASDLIVRPRKMQKDYNRIALVLHKEKEGMPRSQAHVAKVLTEREKRSVGMLKRCATVSVTAHEQAGRRADKWLNAFCNEKSRSVIGEHDFPENYRKQLRLLPMALRNRMKNGQFGDPVLDAAWGEPNDLGYDDDAEDVALDDSEHSADVQKQLIDLAMADIAARYEGVLPALQDRTLHSRPAYAELDRCVASGRLADEWLEIASAVPLPLLSSADVDFLLWRTVGSSVSNRMEPVMLSPVQDLPSLEHLMAATSTETNPARVLSASAPPATFMLDNIGQVLEYIDTEHFSMDTIISMPDGFLDDMVATMGVRGVDVSDEVDAVSAKLLIGRASELNKGAVRKLISRGARATFSAVAYSSQTMGMLDAPELDDKHASLSQRRDSGMEAA